VVEFGDVVSVDPIFVDGFKGGKRRKAIGSLMGDISQALATVSG
jgi:hypothetical protein